MLRAGLRGLAGAARCPRPARAVLRVLQGRAMPPNRMCWATEVWRHFQPAVAAPTFAPPSTSAMAAANEPFRAASISAVAPWPGGLTG